MDDVRLEFFEKFNFINLPLKYLYYYYASLSSQNMWTRPIKCARAPRILTLSHSFSEKKTFILLTLNSFFVCEQTSPKEEDQ